MTGLARRESSNPVPFGALPNPHDRFPDCVMLEISIEPDQPTTYKLILTANFNLQEQRLPVGTVYFGLKRCELKFKLSNAKSALKKRNQYEEFFHTIQTEVSNQESDSNTRELTAAISPTLKTTNIQGDTASFKQTLPVSQISCKGSETEPKWVFQNRRVDYNHLIGLIKEMDVAQIERLINDERMHVEAQFCANHEDIYFKDIPDEWGVDKSDSNAIAAVKTALGKLLFPEDAPYFSRHEVHHD